MDREEARKKFGQLWEMKIALISFDFIMTFLARNVSKLKKSNFLGKIHR